MNNIADVKQSKAYGDTRIDCRGDTSLVKPTDCRLSTQGTC